jgi:acetyl-CoA C-acetyltransferase
MNDRDPIVIAGMARTPLGDFQGGLSASTAPELGAVAIKAALERAGVPPEDVDEVIMGCVLPAGLGQAPARQAAIHAGIPVEVGALTINKMCGSGMKAAMLGIDLIEVGTDDIVVAGGLESMSNAPYLMQKVRNGLRMGHGEIKDHMFLDGLEDAYDPGRLMGTYADETAQDYQFSRDDQDAYAIESLNRARKATEEGWFDKEITPVTVKTRKGETTVARDEHPFSVDTENVPKLRPAFAKDGTVTAANSSAISDGAAALVLMRESEAERRGITPLAHIIGHATNSSAPERFTTAPVGAIERLLDKVGWKADDADLYEVNEAFAVVTMVAMRDLGLSHEKVNVHGGACALGHPLGATGARIMATLLGAMDQRDVKRGIAGLCIGGGEATAIAVERLT